MTATEMTKTLFLPIPAREAWDYLIQPDKLAQWFHAPKKPLTVGEDYTLYGRDSGDKVCWGQVVSMTPHSSLVYTFSVKPVPDAVTTVHWTLDEVTGGTRITLRHTGFDQMGAEGFDLILAFDKGWDGHLGEMRDAVIQ